MEIQFRTAPARRLVGIRHVGAYPQIGAAFGRLGDWVRGQSVDFGPLIAVYWDDPRQVPEGELRSDACVEIPGGDVAAGEGMSVLELPSTECAYARYTGPYSGLGAAWGELMAGIFAAGRQPGCGPGYEVYVNNCDQVADERELITDLYQPVAPR